MSVVVDRLAEAIRTVSSTEKEHDPDSAARAALNELAAIVDESWEAYADATNIPGWTAAPRCSDAWRWPRRNRRAPSPLPRPDQRVRGRRDVPDRTCLLLAAGEAGPWEYDWATGGAMVPGGSGRTRRRHDRSRLREDEIVRLRRERRPVAPVLPPPPDDVYYEATSRTTIIGGSTDRSRREVRAFGLMAGDSFRWPVLYGTPTTSDDGQLLGPFTETEWTERTRRREAEEARLAQERREAREAAAREMAREILTETAPIEDRIQRLAEIIIAAEYGGWDDLR